MNWIAYARKALVAAVAALGQLGIALTEGSAGGEAVTPVEWVSVALAAAAALGVYATANGPHPDGRHERTEQG